MSLEVSLYATNARVLKRWSDALTSSANEFAVTQARQVNRVSRSAIQLVHLQSLTEPERLQLLSEPCCDTVIMSDMPDVGEAKQMILSGIKGYANTYMHDTLLPELVVQVEAGNVWAVPEVLQSILQSFLQNQPREVSRYDTSELTERELQVLEQMRSGAGNRLIAIALGISERTVKAHVSSILNKTGAPDRVRLIIGNRGQDGTYEH